ncbi:methyltransferase domain-containing protein [Herbiconiux sp. 11R-BC]|uniref:methyltransferase domain-containing protein n=1 Tax=Herbiconiux sp. 11R-BC TaxID=3111637 RepID=UPI003C03E9C0
MTERKYDNAYSAENLYGHAMALLRDHADPAAGDAIHLDIACGYGAIAEVVEAELGLRYVGVDIDEPAVEALRKRGFEAHGASLAEPGTVLAALRRIVAGRSVASITVLDGLEHFPDGTELLAALRALLAENSAVVVFSIPNVTHRDVGYKLALGSWEYTSTGLLDNTHVRLFGELELERVLRAAGLHRVGRNDFLLSRSDQHYPIGHPVLQPGTTINQFFNELRDQAEPNGRVNQFVWACVPGPARESSSASAPAAPTADPFLSVVVRTQGRRPAEIEETLLCLAGQTNTDFEVVVIAHNVDVATQIQIEGAIEGLPDWLRAASKLVLVDHGNRATLLNTGLDEARGRYVVALDDDDLVFAHWVESFATLEKKYPGRVLRSVCGRQESDRVAVRQGAGTRAESAVSMIYAKEFSFIEHLSLNSSPFMSVALPRALSRDLGIRFDESLTTTEDWDYLLRAVSTVGVADSGRLTAIYRGWAAQESSITEHVREEWLLNQYAVDRKIDSQPILLPAGETRAIRRLVRERQTPPPPPPALEPVPERDVDAEINERLRERDALHHRLVSLLESRSWRASGAMRAVGVLTGRGRPIKASAVLLMTNDELRAVIESIESSRSWKWTKALRRG